MNQNMQCPACLTAVAPETRFCPQCGRSLHASGADDNVVYLTPAQPPAGEVSVDPLTGTYAPGDLPGVAAPIPVSEPNIADSFFDGVETGAYSNWTLEPEVDREPRIIGSMLAAAAGILLVVALVVYVLEVRRGAFGQIAGGFVLLAMIAWIIYLSLPREQQHDALVAWHARWSQRIERFVEPVRGRTKAQIDLRRERERFRSMRLERTRRITELGEAAYRQFRSGDAAPDIVEHGRRVLAIEQQMLLQDARMHEINLAGQPAHEHVNSSDETSDNPKTKRRMRRRKPRR